MGRAGRALTWVALCLWALVCLLPICWVAVTSVKGLADIDKPPAYLPFVDFTPSLDAWRFVLFDAHENLLRPLANSAVIAVAAAAVSVTVAAMAVYGLTRFARGLLPPGPVMALMLASRALPPVVMVLPLYVALVATGLRDTRAAMILIYGAANLPVALWLLLPAFGPRATDQEEAARLDGASHGTILFGIVLPMIRPAVAAAAFVVFLLSWNEYLFAAILTADRALTLPPWAAGQLSMKEAQVGGGAEELAHLSAATVLMILPALGLAAFVQRWIGRSVTRRR